MPSKGHEVDGQSAQNRELAVLPPPRRVRFAEDLQVVLHISRGELIEEKEIIWYNKFDFTVFRSEAIDEMREYMRKHGVTSPDEALDCLYQPQPALQSIFSMDSTS